ncbi:hypothetical protein, conserved [Trypanosoma brucei gambiense DAL972]|uniref:Uncharacterized protein n=3 Tax=Trypanosoma brucei TaxID=5691 RepID=D0A8I6_TRYB9|nr:hypothetical protein, conserved [Trypanosoma brucei gambiense DAL972]RHW67713.1 hypothetical protein DPX39_110069600 [Trypanosoma brucei equiperdum]6HIV_Ae Chain Ae, mL41 [Trypanosoma brucei brucei]6HIX_Ae Chain Ae, ml41 [Trypanosoma brucei brucei]CBH17987.1 hypothetical protein, conserved [Trypanosoma brucei gambiense DAL972]|eukprot:XP_011780251.1 hypothetical protein, conserved [Trypanosoma brucei gambiense DAL972]
MLRCSCACRRGVYHNAPSVYPFVKPFHDTPYDQDRGRHDSVGQRYRKNSWPEWMDNGADGTGYGIGLHRTHPLSRLRGNLKRSPSHVPRVLGMMIQGVWHKSGVKLYFRGGKPPNPSVHPYLTGEPCPLYGWKVTDESVIRQFNMPSIDGTNFRYKPYVALQERKIMGVQVPSDSVSLASGRTTESKPLAKRLFFWR